jgi:hypothetical protein
LRWRLFDNLEQILCLRVARWLNIRIGLLEEWCVVYASSAEPMVVLM